MGAESDEPPSGLWGKVDLEDLPVPNASDAKQEPPLLTRKPTLLGYVVPELDRPVAGSPARGIPSTGRPSPAGGLGISNKPTTPERERLGQLVDSLSEAQRNLPISPGRTLIGGSFPAGLPNAGPTGAGGGAISKGTLLGVPAPVLEPAFDVAATLAVQNAMRPTPERGTPQAGHLGRFRIVRKIGTGRAGAVFQAQRDDAPAGSQLIAVKVLREQVYQDAAALKALFREARLAALMDHRNVVRVIDIGYYKRQPYVVMDYVDGLSFATVLAHPVDVPLPVGMRIICDALYGLDYAHKLTDAAGNKLGLVHCDVSPENILVGIDGVARVTDFGVARTREEHGEEFVFRGRAAYSAPELLGGEQNVSPQTDVYSVGAVLFRFVTGVSPFAGKTEDDRIANALTRPAPRLRELNAKLPEWLDQICSRAVNRDPSRRYATCSEMAMAIEREAGSEGLLADRQSVGDWVRKVRKSLAGEEAFGATELAALAADVKRRARSEGIAPTQLNVPIPKLGAAGEIKAEESPTQEVEESSTLQFRLGIGATLVLLVAVFAAWSWLSPVSFQEFIGQDVQQEPSGPRPHPSASAAVLKASEVKQQRANDVAAPAPQMSETPRVVAPAVAASAPAKVGEAPVAPKPAVPAAQAVKPQEATKVNAATKVSVVPVTAKSDAPKATQPVVSVSIPTAAAVQVAPVAPPIVVPPPASFGGR